VQPIRRRLHLGAAEVIRIMQDLALEIGRVHHVEVNDADRAYPRRRQIDGRRAAQASCADQQHLAAQQLELAGLAHLLQQSVAAIAQSLLLGQHLGNLELIARVLPGVEASDQRDRLGVSHLLQVARRQQRAHPARTIDDQRLVPVRLVLLDLQLQKAARHKHRAGQVSLHKLIALAHVDNRELLPARQPLMQLLGRHLRNLAPGKLQQLVAIEWRHLNVLGRPP